MLLGLATITIGIMVSSLVVLVAGLLVSAAGAVSAWRGGLYYDIRGQSKDIVAAVREDPHIEEPGPEARVHDAEAEKKSHELDQTRRRLIASSRRAGVPPLRPVGAVLMLAVCVWVLVSQGIYPTSARGQNNALRDLGIAIVVALGALRLLMAGPRTWISLLTGLAGLCLTVFGLTASHDSAGVVVSEVVGGCAVVVGSLLCLDHRERTQAGP